MTSISMKEIRKAWNDAVDALNEHNHKTRPPSMEWLFMVELKKLDYDMSEIVTHTYANYAGERHSYNVIEKENEEYKNEISELNSQLADTTCNYRKYSQQLDDMDKIIEHLESSLTTARYYIYLSGMCGFLLGLACLFLVV